MKVTEGMPIPDNTAPLFNLGCKAMVRSDSPSFAPICPANLFDRSILRERPVCTGFQVPCIVGEHVCFASNRSRYRLDFDDNGRVEKPNSLSLRAIKL